MLLFVLILALLIGARLYYVFIQSPLMPEGLGRFLDNPWTILILTGGIHIHGAFRPGGIAPFAFARWRKPLMALLWPGRGSWARRSAKLSGASPNFINQELYGPPTTPPWGLRIDAESTASRPTTTWLPILKAYAFNRSFSTSRSGTRGLWAAFLTSRFEDRLRPGDLRCLT